MALPTSHNVVTAAQLGSTLSSYNTKLNARFKPKQTAVEDPTASGTTLTAIDSITQNTNGEITATKKTIQDGTISQKGVVQLSTAINSSSKSIAATSSAVKAAYDLANGKQDPITFDGTYSASTNKAATVSTVTTAIAALDGTVSGTPSAAKTLTAFSQTDGKVSATFANIAIAESQVTNLSTDLAAKAPLASPELTGTPTAPTATAGTNTTQIATTAFVKTAVDNAIATADALTYKGTVAGGSTGDYGALTPAASKGDVYKVSTAGKVDGVKVEVGDMLVCNTDSTAAATSSNYSTIVANWDFIQTNIDGAVTSSASSVTTNTVAIFDGTTGKIIKSSGYTIGKSVPSNAVFTDASVTAVGNHYTPSRDTSADKSASASGATAAWSIDVVKGVTLQTDGKGHVTGVAVTSGKIPANPNTDTKVTSADNHYTPETASGSEIAASASGATAAWSIDVVKGVSLNTDGKGHVTGISVTSGKIPGNPNTDTKVKATAKTDNVNYKILATASASPTSGNATEAVYDADITLNPSTNTIAANISGNAATATSATSATSATTASNYASGGTIETALSGKAASGHTHTTTIASSTGTNQITLAHGGKYAITAGGTSYIFTMPGSGNTDTKVTQTALAGTETDTYPVLLAPTGQTSTQTTTSNFATALNYKPSTNTLAANISGDAATASAAKSGSALETAINGKVSTSTTVNGHALSGNVTVTAADVSAVRYDTASQGLSSTQKSNARTNIGAGTSNLAIGTTATTAAAGNHTHTTSIATSTGTSSIELTPGGKYSISAGGTTCIFQNGTEMTDQEVTDLLGALT